MMQIPLVIAITGREQGETLPWGYILRVSWPGKEAGRSPVNAVKAIVAAVVLGTAMAAFFVLKDPLYLAFQKWDLIPSVSVRPTIPEVFLLFGAFGAVAGAGLVILLVFGLAVSVAAFEDRSPLKSFARGFTIFQGNPWKMVSHLIRTFVMSGSLIAVSFLSVMFAIPIFGYLFFCLPV